MIIIKISHDMHGKTIAIILLLAILAIIIIIITRVSIIMPGW